MIVASAESPKRFIRRVYAQGLFGQFDHDLNLADAQPENPSLLILYGENGTGKTTLLWLLYHLLSKQGKRGHRSYLARHQFKKILVSFSDGLEVSAERGKAERGSFKMKVCCGAAEPDTFLYEADSENDVLSAVTDDPVHIRFSAGLPAFNLSFLPHDRSTKIDVGSRRWARPARRSTTLYVKEVSPIQSSINKAIGTARQQAIGASNQGQLTVNAIYTELVRQIAHVPVTPPESGLEEERIRLLGRLQEQSRLTHEYSKVGLISALDVEGLLQTLKTMPANKFYIVDKMLEPFLRGNEARLQALNVLYVALNTAVDSVNSLYLNKQISIHLERGLNISTSHGGILLPEQLSSGEQELLILFCEVISALRPDAMLFIDEPELSLNVSWQRVLLSSLLKCASGSAVQFVIATHSIELLAQYRANVTRLSNRVIGGLATPEPAGPRQG